MNSLELHDTIVRSQQGDELAFGRIYDLLYDRVYAYIYRRVLDAAAAEDITSNVFYKLLTVLHTFSWKHEPGFYAWVFRVAVNELNDYFRAGQRCVLAADWLEMHDDNHATQQTQQAIDAQILQADLHRALTTLDRQSREIVELFYFAHLDHKAIALIVGKREGAVRVSLHRAIQKLRTAMQSHRKELSHE